MFPGIVTSILGLEMDSKYIISLEVNPSDNHRYKYINGKWVVVGKAESHCEEMLKYIHPDSPASGRHWTSSKVSFKKIKVTNNKSKSNKRGLVRDIIVLTVVLTSKGFNAKCEKYCFLSLYLTRSTPTQD